MARLTMEFAIDVGDKSPAELKGLQRVFHDHGAATLRVGDADGTIIGWPMEPVEGEWNLVEDEPAFKPWTASCGFHDDHYNMRTAAYCAKVRAEANAAVR